MMTTFFLFLRDIMQNRTKVILFALTAVLLFLSPIQQTTGLFRLKKLSGVMDEQPKPKFTVDHWKDHHFQDDAETYLQQHYGFREPLTRLYNQYIWDFYGKTFAKDRNWVFVSDDGWYYESRYVKEYYEGNSWDYAEDSIQMAKILAEKALMLSQVQQILEELDIHLFVLLEPGKEQIYPEHIPENTQYHREKVFSAHDFLHQRFEALDINYIDAGEWFQQMKDTVDFLLFPQTGTHWSNLASMYVADSLIRYMEDLGNINIQNFTIGNKYVRTKEPDDDLEQWLNLIRPLKRAPNYYAKIRLEKDPMAIKPKLITIGDSFYWNLLNHAAFKKIFSGYPYWYYFSTAYYNGSFETSITDIDLLEEVLSADFIMLAYSTPQQYELGNGFAEQFLLEWCYDDDETESLKKEMRERIRLNQNWMSTITERAEALNISVDSVLNLESSYFIEKYPNVCFPALNDSVPLNRSSKADRLVSRIQTEKHD